MLKKDKKIPDEFKTYEEAVEFWESHDSTEYFDILEEVEITVDIQRRHYLIELDENSARLLQEDASKKGISASYLASKLIKKCLLVRGRGFHCFDTGCRVRHVFFRISLKSMLIYV